MSAYLDAVGAFPTDLEHDPIAAELAQVFRALPAQSEQMRGVVSHYPRRDLPGKCVAITTVFHTLPDEHIMEDMPGVQRLLLRLGDGRATAGMLFEVRQVWQTEGDEPRLIEATVEVTDRFRSRAMRDIHTGLFRNGAVNRITIDMTRAGHLSKYGGGTRRGLIWCDRSFGIGQPRPYSAAYRIRPHSEVRLDLDPQAVTALREFVTRF